MAVPSLRPKAAVDAGRGRRNRRVRVPSSRWRERLRSWTTRILPVLFVLCMLPAAGASAPWPSGTGNEEDVSLPPPRLAGGISSLASGPASDAAPDRRLLDARSTCASGGVGSSEYDTGLHAAALFIIWFVSSLGCGFPIMAAKLPGLRIPRRFFFAVRHFGTGVLIATAFVHLLPTAFISLGNPCLGPFWTKDYQAMPGAIALAAIFLVSVIEMVLHPSGHVPARARAVARSPLRTCKEESASVSGEEAADSEGRDPIRDLGPLHGRSSSLAQGLFQLDQAAGAAASSADEVSLHGRLEAPVSRAKSGSVHAEEANSVSGLGPERKRNKERLQCILLEMGILFHSVFIGMALSVSIGSDFVVLLIAIVFHQTFEGLALGSRISAIEWGSKTWQPWLMALAYGCTTPIGQAIGLATHTLYSPDSEVGLILVGVMNAISAGLLTFASLVELLSEDFLSDESWRHLRGRRRVVACLLVFFGAFSMGLVGAWA
ncbi:hypothetical protein E4U41_004900 [Claviceps citrina]|nr:hypothetical protein E4U41_004900 [Claviceps citrina]